MSELLGIDLSHRSGFEAMVGHAQRAEPGPDLLSAILTEPPPDGTPLTDVEVHGLVFSLIGAGLIPPARSLLTATLRLLRDPVTAAGLRRDRGVVPAAVEELLRLDPGGIDDVDRVLRAVADVDLPGGSIPAGGLVVASLGAAHRDPDVFPEPHVLRPARPGPRHLAFAPGMHHCVGAALARLQLEVGLSGLITRLTGLGLDGDPSLQDGVLGIRNPVALPVTWTEDAGRASG